MATYDERTSAALSATVSWLEDELREAKTMIVKQQQALDQLSAQMWEMTSSLHKSEDLIASVVPRLDVLPQYDGQLRLLKDDVARFHEQGLATDSRLTELARVRQTESDRDRAVLNDLTHRLDIAERALAGVAPRFETLDEASRRSMESVAYVRQRADELDREIEALDGRLNRVAETGGRSEHEFARLTGEIETLHRQDATAADRVQMYTELLKRLEAQIALVSSEVAVKQDVLERIEIARLELHRLEERTSILESASGDLRETDEDLARLITMLEGRDKGFHDRLMGLHSDLASYRAVVAEQFQRLHQSQERQKRRQIEDLEREIREMRIHAFRPVEE